MAKVISEQVITKWADEGWFVRGWVRGINKMVNSIPFCCNSKGLLYFEYINKVYTVPEGFSDSRYLQKELKYDCCEDLGMLSGPDLTADLHQ